MWSKLENNYGLTGKFLKALKSLYASFKCAVRVNDYTSEWFDVKSGFKQGCLVSTTLFNLFLNDISELFEQSNRGVKINGKIISHLFYADDLVLITENEEDLQHLLTLLSQWCDINNIKINTDKSKIMHFRPPSKQKTKFNFKCNDDVIECVESYRYLWLNVN